MTSKKQPHSSPGAAPHQKGAAPHQKSAASQKGAPRRREAGGRDRKFALIGAITALGYSVWHSLVGVITTIWGTARRIDSALWRVLVAGFTHVSNAVHLITDWILDGGKLFVKWLPTRAGQGYCALFGACAIITGLWITDELRGASLTLKAAQAGAGATAPLDSADPVMARIGGDYIHLSEVEAAARSAGSLQPRARLALDSALTRELVATFIDQRLLARAAQRDDLDTVSNTLLEVRLRVARERILAAAYIDEIIATEVSDAQVLALYKAQSDLTSLGEEIRIRHILVPNRASAVSIIDAVNNGADFATIARGRSLDRGTAPHGGDTGYITRDMVTNEFGRIAFAIEEGKISPPFRTSEGWNIVKILERRQSEEIAFSAVEDNLRRFLTLRSINTTLAALKQDYDVVIYDHDTDADQESAITTGG